MEITALITSFVIWLSQKGEEKLLLEPFFNKVKRKIRGEVFDNFQKKLRKSLLDGFKDLFEEICLGDEEDRNNVLKANWAFERLFQEGSLGILAAPSTTELAQLIQSEDQERLVNFLVAIIFQALHKEGVEFRLYDYEVKDRLHLTLDEVFNKLEGEVIKNEDFYRLVDFYRQELLFSEIKEIRRYFESQVEEELERRRAKSSAPALIECGLVSADKFLRIDEMPVSQEDAIVVGRWPTYQNIINREVVVTKETRHIIEQLKEQFRSGRR